MNERLAPVGAHFRMISAWAWRRVALPKIFTLTMVFVYLFLLPGWIMGIFDPPDTLQGMVGLVSMHLISVLIVIGALTGIPAALAGQNRVERWSIIAIFTGVGMYLTIVLIIHSLGLGNRLPQASTIMALTPILAARLYWVYRRPIAASEEVLMPHRGDGERLS